MGIDRYLYDGDGRVCAIESQTALIGYLYDADGTRVAKGRLSAWSCDPSVNGFAVTTDYVLGMGGEQLTEMRGGVWQHTNVFAGGKLLGTYDQQGLHFYLDDPLGTRRVQTDYAGNLQQTCASLPFGDQLSCSGSITSPTEHHFTGKERDAESGLDYFGARYYASSMGRFMSPDWSAKQEPVPYSKLDDPQTLNLYSYVGNNPLSRADKDGHCFPFCLALAGGGVLAEEAPLAFTGPVGWTVIGVTAVGVAGVAAYQYFHQDAAPSSPAPSTGATPVPAGLVGTDPTPTKGRTNSGPLAPENGGTGDAGKDFGTLTGGKSGPAPAGSTLPPLDTSRRERYTIETR